MAVEGEPHRPAPVDAFSQSIGPSPRLAGTVGELALVGYPDAPEGRGCADPARGETAVGGGHEMVTNAPQRGDIRRHESAR